MQMNDMILVSVGQDHPDAVVGAVRDVREVGEHEIDTQHLLVGEAQAAVDRKDAILAFDREHVAADFTDAP